MSTIFIDESGDTGFKLEKSSSYFVLSATIFEMSSSLIDANNRIEMLLENFNSKFEFHFTKNSQKTREIFLAEINQMQFYWFSICVDKRKIKFDTMKQKEYFLHKVSSYLCSNLGNKVINANIIFDKKDSKSFYLRISKNLKIQFGDKIKKVVAKESKKEKLLQIADYVAGVSNQRLKNPKYGNDLYQKYLRKKEGNTQIWPK